MTTRFGTAEELRAFQTRIARYARWEEENPISLSPQQAIEAVGFLYDLLPPEARNANDDPRDEGVQRMMAVMSKLGCGTGDKTWPRLPFRKDHLSANPSQFPSLVKNFSYS